MNSMQLLSVGSWAPFDHLFRMDHYPEEGETIIVESGGLPNEPYFGDCSINLAYIAAKLGIQTGLSTVVGTDFPSSGYLDHLIRAGIDTSGVIILPDQRCGHNYLYFDSHGKGFCFSWLGAAQKQNEVAIPLIQIAQAGHVVVNEMFSNHTLATIKKAHSQGARTYINGMIETAGDLLTEFLSHANVLFINESEFSRLLEKLELDQAGFFARFPLEILFITLGKQGCRVLTSEAVVEIPIARERTKIDTTGAGDSFAGGTIAALIKGYEPITAARIGSTVSSYIIESWGCQTNAPDWTQVIERYEQNFGALQK
jgi:sugar/nucleoside kinase (ribokinase family)